MLCCASKCDVIEEIGLLYYVTRRKSLKAIFNPHMSGHKMNLPLLNSSQTFLHVARRAFHLIIILIHQQPCPLLLLLFLSKFTPSQYCTVLYCTVLCCAVLYCTVRYCLKVHPLTLRGRLSVRTGKAASHSI